MLALQNPVDFTRASLGKRLLDFAAGQIKQRADGESGPEKWHANRGKYGQKKQAKGIPVGRGLREPKGRERMLDMAEIVGEREITPESAIMSAGTDDAMNKLAQWFTAGGKSEPNCEPSGTKDQPPRHWYELTEEDVETVEDAIMAGVGDFLAGTESAGAGSVAV